MRDSRLSPLRFPPAALVLGLLALAAGALAQGRANLSGRWFFDPGRKQVYLRSVSPEGTAAKMSEIAAVMGLARAESTVFELGADREGPYFSITDKNTQVPVRRRVTVQRTGAELVMTDRATGDRFRLRPIDPEHIDLIDEQKRTVIPLTRR